MLVLQEPSKPLNGAVPWEFLSKYSLLQKSIKWSLHWEASLSQA